jgi:hypothetical protein
MRTAILRLGVALGAAILASAASADGTLRDFTRGLRSQGGPDLYAISGYRSPLGPRPTVRSGRLAPAVGPRCGLGQALAPTGRDCVADLNRNLRGDPLETRQDP